MAPGRLDLICYTDLRTAGRRPVRGAPYAGGGDGAHIMPNLGATELLIILLIIVVLFGASRLPQIGRGLGEGIRNFRRGVKDSGREQIEDGAEAKDRAAS